MKRENLLLATEENQVVYIGEKLLTALRRREMPTPFGYPAGCLAAKDLFLLVLAEAAALCREERELLTSLCREEVPQAGPVLFAVDHLHQGSKSLIKALSAEEDVLLDTIFFGFRLRVQRKTASVLILQVGEQTVELPVSASQAPLLIFNQVEGLTYFQAVRLGEAAQTEQAGPVEMEPQAERLLDVLSGKRWAARWDSDFLTAKPRQLVEIFPPVLAERLMKIAEDPEPQPVMSSCDKAQPLRISYLPVTLNGQRLRQWEVLLREDVLDVLEAASTAYSQMKAQGDGGRIEEIYTFGLRGEDERVRRIRFLLQKAAVTNTTILLTGESGTGKTFLAKKIHQCSNRNKEAFVQVNCAAIPDHLIESELFGYEGGAFTGARRRGKAGYFELAEGGTLFLDEITDMPLHLQGKLLEAIQNRTYFRVGGETKRRADVRLIIATNKNLRALVDSHLFREDLYYRINGFPIELPPLRERMDSLFSIITDLLPEICDRLGIEQRVLSMEALEELQAYRWPGNIRELENVLEKACILADGKMIMAEEIAFSQNWTDGKAKKRTLREQREEFEREVIARTLHQYGGSKRRTAQALDIGKTSLFEKLRKYGLEDREKEEESDADDFD